MNVKVVPALLGASLLISLSGVTSIAQPVTVSDEDQIRAVIQSVDPATREVQLLGPQGETLTVMAGPEVRNFQQLKSGDQVVVTYREALAAELAKPGSSAPSPHLVQRMERAAPGATPGARTEQMLQARVKITRIDHKHNLVSFIGPAKVERTVDVVDPKMRDFLRTLKVGDEVDLTYTEAIALSVEKAPN
jgi:hypothetical protein